MEDRGDHRERGQQENRSWNAERGVEPHVRHEVLDRCEHGRGQEDLADERQCLGRVLVVQAVVVTTDIRQRNEHPDPTDRADQSAPKGIEMEVLLQK